MSAQHETPRIALARVDGLLNKVFVLGLSLLTVDVIQNAIRQLKYLNPWWFWGTLTALMISVAGSVAAAFVIGFTRYWYRAMVLVLLFAMITWKFQMVDSAHLPKDYKPWIWWALGPVTLAAVGAWQKRWAYLALIVGPIIWLAVLTSPEGGGVPLGLALQDSLYSFFFSTALAVMAMVLRDQASELDRENSLALDALLGRTRVDVMNRERALFNSLLHDKVLSTLELASTATNDKSTQRAKASAIDAIARIDREWNYAFTQTDEFSTDALLPPLIEAINRLSEDFKVQVSGKGPITVPFGVASGIYEATMLAVNNSLAHAPSATERTVRIRLSAKGLKVVISDNGRGFRMSNVHKTALGVRWTIFARLESIGVKPSLDSAPGTGTTWILEWQR